MRKSLLIISIAIGSFTAIFSCHDSIRSPGNTGLSIEDTSLFIPPDSTAIPNDEFGQMVRYGRDLILNTARYIGPNGTEGKYLGNKMNCTNCHLNAGIRPYAFPFFSSYALYPQYRARENAVLNLGQRINNCIERPHNGKSLPLNCREMIAMECYIKWVGTNVPVGHHVKGDENFEIVIPDHAADPQKGAEVYSRFCVSCHGINGEGKFTVDSSTYIYPPLWGEQSFQEGSSPSRVLKAASFIKANMPDKMATWRKPILSDEQAIDVAAFINDDEVHYRPRKKNPENRDYPNAKTKAIDYDKGPYEDTFSEKEHKYGPFKPIIEYHKAHGLPVTY